MGLEWRSAEVTRTPLNRRPCGIETFRVEGTIDFEPVHAKWDGRWLTASKALCDQVALAMAVEATFVEAGLAPALGDLCLGPAPEEYMLAVLACCDVIDVAEFEVRGHRRLIVPDAEGTAPA